MNSNKIIINNALLIYGSIVVFFLLMKFLGLDEVSELRFVNFVFVLWGANRAIKMNIQQNDQSLYISNLSVGFATSFIGVLLTILGLIVYVSFMDSNFMTILENSHFWGKNLNLVKVTFALAIEGFASSLICSFILMQYYKNYKYIPNIEQTA